MLVLHAIEHLNTGGEERLLCSLIRELARFSDQGLKQHAVVLKGGELMGELEKTGIDHTNLEGKGPLGRMRSLMEILLDCNPDILHTRLSSAGYWLRTAAILTKSRARRVHAHAGATFAGAGLKRRVLEKAFAPFTQCHVCVSESVRAHLESHGFSQQRLVVLPNAIDIRSIRQRDPHAFATPPRLLCLGRLERVKGQDVLVEALRLLQSRKMLCQCDIVGDGSQRQKLERSVRDSALSRHVRFLGTRLDFFQHLHEYDLFVQPSRSEGLSLALLEAMAARLPIAATDVGDSRKVLREYALFAEAENPKDLARAIAAAMKDQPAALRRASMAADVVRVYGIEALATAYKDLFERILGRTIGGATCV